MEVTSELESFNLLMHIGSSSWSGGVCPNILILDTRKHTCFDHHQCTCYSHLNIQLIRLQHCSVHEHNICDLQHSAVDQLQLLRIFAAHLVWFVLDEAWDEGVPEIAKMVREGIIVRIASFL